MLTYAAGELLRPDAPYLNRTSLPEWYVFQDHFQSVQGFAEEIVTGFSSVATDRLYFSQQLICFSSVSY